MKQKITHQWIVVTLAVFAGVLTIGLTGVAFWLSFEHLHDVAGAHGLSPVSPRSWAWPATLDTFIIIGEVLILRASLLGKTDWWAFTLAAVGSGGSITLNVVGVGGQAGALDYTVAAVPPVAALFAFGALMRQLHGVIQGYLADSVPEPVSAPAARVREDVVKEDKASKRPAPVIPASRVRVDLVKRDKAAVSGLHLVGGTGTRGGKIPKLVREVLSADPGASNADIRSAVLKEFGPDTKADSIRKAINRTRQEMSA